MPHRTATPLQPLRYTNMLLGFSLAAVVVLLSALLTYQAAASFARSGRAVQEAYQVLDGLQLIEIRYAEAVSALRAYVITGNEDFLTEYRATVAQVEPAVAAARAQATGNALLAGQLEEIARQMHQRVQDLDAGLVAYTGGGLPAVLAVNRARQAREPEKLLTNLLAENKRQREQELRAHIELDAQRLMRLRLTLGLFFVTSLGLLALFYLRTRRDLEARAQAEQEVERQRRFANTIIENAPMGVYIKETAGFTLVRVNRFVEEITGRTRDEMLGKDDSQFVGGENAAALIQSERDLVARRQLQSFEEIQIETVRGRRTLHVRKVLIPDETGQIRYLLGLSEDVTDRRRAELGQRQFAETLERKSRELQAANKELESFSYSVSHDLRAPLRAVEGYAAILEEDYSASLDEEGRRFLRNIRDGATRMGQLIQDLLAFSRLGRQPLALGETDTRYLVQNVWEQIRSAHPEMKAELVLGELPASYGDARLLQQAWTNLLDNAVKYSSKVPRPEIRISGETDRTEATFSIQDNGVGFDMRYYDKLFNVFQRLHSETEYAGTGVGLAIVHRVIARHGGRVWARSEPGKGTCFSFALPHRQPDSPAAEGRT